MTDSEDPKASGLVIIAVFVALIGIAAWAIWANATGEPPREQPPPPTREGR